MWTFNKKAGPFFDPALSYPENIFSKDFLGSIEPFAIMVVAQTS
jgi:hypothetical protein